MSGIGKPVYFDNKWYKSARDLSNVIGVPYETLCYRIRNNQRLDESNLITKYSVVVNGKKYNSIRHAAEEHGLHKAVVQRRIREGWSIQKSLKTKVRPQSIKIVLEGITYNSLKEACKAYGTTYYAVIRKLEQGKSYDQAFGIESSDPVKCNGKLYIISNSKNNKIYVGITTQTLKARFYGHVYSANKRKSKTKLAKAMRKIGIKHFKIKILRKASNKKDLRDLEIRYIKKYNSIKEGYNTVNSGCCLGEKIGRIVEYDGKIFTSVKQLASYLDLSYAATRGRLRRNTL